jgi:hypothetical protein
MRQSNTSRNTLKTTQNPFLPLTLTTMLFFLTSLALPQASAQARHPQANPNAGAGNIIVQSQFGGSIFGFDIDTNGTEGVLAEGQSQSDGSVLAAIETFDQRTGQILSVVRQTQTADDYIALGIFGKSTALIEHEHPLALFNVQRTFALLNENSGRFTGRWTPPLDSNHIVNQVRRADVGGNSVVYAMDSALSPIPVAFGTNILANTFSGVFPVTDRDFNFEVPPVVALDSLTNQVIMGHATLSQFIVPPKIGILDLASGNFTKFQGHGLGQINGIAVDSADGVVCTTTSFDAAVQFYDLATQTGTSQNLPGATNGLFAGQHIEFDAVNKLFLIAQPFSSTTPSGSSIQVYDIHGNFVESVDGLNFPGESAVFPAHIALHPTQRSGFIDGPDTNVTNIQSFTY